MSIDAAASHFSINFKVKQRQAIKTFSMGKTHLWSSLLGLENLFAINASLCTYQRSSK